MHGYTYEFMYVIHVYFILGTCIHIMSMHVNVTIQVRPKHVCHRVHGLNLASIAFFKFQFESEMEDRRDLLLVYAPDLIPMFLSTEKLELTDWLEPFGTLSILYTKTCSLTDRYLHKMRY